jgi:hypothetical protein
MSSTHPSLDVRSERNLITGSPGGEVGDALPGHAWNRDKLYRGKSRPLDTSMDHNPRPTHHTHTPVEEQLLEVLSRSLGGCGGSEPTDTALLAQIVIFNGLLC